MGHIRESFVDLDTAAKVNRVVSGKTIIGNDCVVYEFSPICKEEEEDVVYNVPLKTVFGEKYRTASFFYNQSCLLLTLVANGISDEGVAFREGELQYGSTLLDLWELKDDVDIILSYSKASGHPPTLFRESMHERGITSNKTEYGMVLVFALFSVCYFFLFGEELYHSCVSFL